MDFLFDEHGFFIKKVRILSLENYNITQTEGSVNMDFLETIPCPVEENHEETVCLSFQGRGREGDSVSSGDAGS